MAGEQMDAAKARMAAWLNVGQDEIHFGPSTSQNTFVLAQALRRYLTAGDEVIVTNQDHEANVGAYSDKEFYLDAPAAFVDFVIEAMTPDLADYGVDI